MILLLGILLFACDKPADTETAETDTQDTDCVLTEEEEQALRLSYCEYLVSCTDFTLTLEDCTEGMSPAEGCVPNCENIHECLNVGGIPSCEEEDTAVPDVPEECVEAYTCPD